MRSLLIILCISLLTGCFARCGAVTRDTFDSVFIGSSESDLLDCAGEPYAVHELCGGALEYEYVERLSAGTELMAENHYFFKVVDGQIVSKHIKVEKRPAYDLMYQEDPNYPTFPPASGSY